MLAKKKYIAKGFKKESGVRTIESCDKQISDIDLNTLIFHGKNETIDAYNNIDIDGDEKILTILLQDKFMCTKHQAMVVSQEIISRMNEWVVIKNKE